MYALYSKYDHLSHWASLFGKKTEEEKRKSVESAIVMTVYHYRDLWALARYIDDVSAIAVTAEQEIDDHVRENHPELQ